MYLEKEREISKMTKPQVYKIVKECIEWIEDFEVAGVEAFYDDEWVNYNENRTEFFEILKKALDIKKENKK